VSRRLFNRPHFKETHRRALFRSLPSRLDTGKAAADNINAFIHLSEIIVYSARRPNKPTRTNNFLTLNIVYFIIERRALYRAFAVFLIQPLSARSGGHPQNESG
jgi:hypothetical protein